MASITLRSLKGSPLTISEMDQNFSNINTELGSKVDVSDYTAADILTKLKTVDGASSGLDADLVDGLNPDITAASNTLAARDGSGRITATTFVGNVTGNVTGNLTGTVTGNASNVSGTVAVANGGTGATTNANARLNLGLGSLAIQNSNNVSITGGAISGLSVTATSLNITGQLSLDSVAGSTGQVLTSNGIGSAPSWSTAFQSGMLMMWPTATAPAGWLLCDGSAVSRSTYATLFSVIGTVYGSGNGTTTFNLPNFADRFPIGAGNNYALNAQGGNKDAVVVSHTHTATVTDPGHQHVIGNNTNTGGLDLGGWSGPYMMASGSRCCDWRSNTENATTGISVTNSITGSSGTNANLPPYTGIGFIIKT